MADSDMAQLSREVMSFTRYLLGRPATSRLTARYESALETLELALPASKFEDRLLRVGALHPLTTEMLDTACAFLARDSLLRTRLFVLTGLLETEPSYAEPFLAQPPGRLRIAAGLARTGLRTALSLALGAPLLLAIRCIS